MHEWCGFERSQHSQQPLTEFERTVRRFVEQQNIFTAWREPEQTNEAHTQKTATNESPCAFASR